MIINSIYALAYCYPNAASTDEPLHQLLRRIKKTIEFILISLTDESVNELMTIIT
jgi:hypothetical protein